MSLINDKKMPYFGNNEFLKYDAPLLITDFIDPALRTQVTMNNIESDIKNEINKLFDQLYDVKRIEEDGEIFTQKVSRFANTNTETQKLKRQLTDVLKKCDVNHAELEDEKFEICINVLEELIRQEIIEEPIRGLFFKKIMDAFLHMINNLRFSGSNSFSYGIMKSLQIGRENFIKREKVKILHEKQRRDDKTLEILEQKLQMTKAESEAAQNAEETAFLVHEEILIENNNDLESKLMDMVNPKHKEMKKKRAKKLMKTRTA